MGLKSGNTLSYSAKSEEKIDVYSYIHKPYISSWPTPEEIKLRDKFVL
jgi:hypothetical protein